MARPQRMSKGRIANHENFIVAQIFAEDSAATVAGGGGDQITIFVIVREPAGFEFLPQIEMAQFNFCAETDVAREKSDERRLRQLLECPDKFPNARARFRMAVGEDVIEPEDVMLEEEFKILRRLGDFMIFEKFANKADVGAAGKLQFLKTVMGVEYRLEDFGKSLDAGAAGVHQRPVDIE